MAIYIAVLFLVIVPFHHHEDEQEHDDCAICLIAHMPAEVGITFVLSIIVILQIAKLVRPSAILLCHAPDSFQSRAPPLL